MRKLREVNFVFIYFLMVWISSYQIPSFWSKETKIKFDPICRCNFLLIKMNEDFSLRFILKHSIIRIESQPWAAVYIIFGFLILDHFKKILALRGVIEGWAKRSLVEKIKSLSQTLSGFSETTPNFNQGQKRNRSIFTKQLISPWSSRTLKYRTYSLLRLMTYFYVRSKRPLLTKS